MGKEMEVQDLISAPFGNKFERHGQQKFPRYPRSICIG